MEKLILISHGGFCEGIKDSVEMILGPQENIETVALMPSEGPEDFETKFKAAAGEADKVVVFADLLGGTPANTVSKLIMQGADYQLYAGMNLPMIISYINGQMLGEEMDYVAGGKDGIVDVVAMLNQDDDE
ncbi:PTS sugar transporter subunit IIA [Staphylococcus pettenkoferi]|uniref:PTS sugar transporter subunit IIA n=1 Tax=Staphylococcus pettenkoferi TaxID=170573 RepID=UPI002274317F|nr:PTS sugar transporter subunit IIA [Staphylococcus pettenkoferi]MCY1573127.1 PTS sugar transporter subunit IIA [Staphylococcus pettenkoferi]MCY1579289.1 PTS sugar transporter subunit IIA [Staphylococcus pettenkoferi]